MSRIMHGAKIATAESANSDPPSVLNRYLIYGRPLVSWKMQEIKEEPLNLEPEIKEEPIDHPEKTRGTFDRPKQPFHQMKFKEQKA